MKPKLLPIVFPFHVQTKNYKMFKELVFHGCNVNVFDMPSKMLYVKDQEHTQTFQRGITQRFVVVQFFSSSSSLIGLKYT